MTVKRQIDRPNPDAESLAAPGSRNKERRQLRLNRKAAAGLAVVAVLAIVSVVAFQRSRSARLGAQVISEALLAEKSGRVDQAIRNLRRYLDSHHDDLAALEVFARIMAQSARSVDEAMAAAEVNDQLLRKDPEGAGRQETRRRMVDLYVRCGDSHRASAVYRLMPGQATFDLRYRTAEKIARELLRRDERAEPKDHRLLAMALEGLAVPGDRPALEESIREYRAALKGDPTDTVSAERLSQLLQVRSNDPAGALRVLDELVRAAPGSADARLVRHRYFTRVHRNDLAAAELEKATELAPGDPSVSLTAANDALRRGDTASAKRHLDRIPDKSKDDLQIRIMRGMIQFSEENPDKAIDSWREGLLMIGGTDADLTWWLAHALLQMGRIAEARPLVSQYHRLSGDETQPLYRFLQAELEEKTGRPARAILGLEWASDRIGEYWQPMLQVALGRCHEALWDRSRALTAYRRAVQLDPQMVDARIAMTRLLSNKPDEAAQEIERGLGQVPDDPSLLVTLAAVRLRQQSARPAGQRAWADFDRALARAAAAAPTSSAVLLMRADRLSLSGDLPGAIALLEKATSSSPRNANLWTTEAEGLARAGRPVEALSLLDRASAPGAAGDGAPIRIARARILLSLGRGREAREGLVRGERDMKPSERSLIWEAAGQVDAARGDYRSAQAAFAEWARLLPDDPRPRLALLDLAQTVGDESAVRSIIETLRALGGPEDIAWRLCRAQELLWTQAPAGQPAHRREARLLEANRILESVLADAPEIPSAHLIKGEVLKRLNKLDEAAACYRRAWDRGASAALPRLIELLVRLHKFAELDGLRLKIEALDLDRMTAAASLRVGDVEATDRFVRKAVEDAKDSPGSASWQARMFDTIGKPDEAEATLRAVVEKKPSDLEPWLELIRHQATLGKAADLSATIDRAKGQIKGVAPDMLEARLLWAANDRTAADRAFGAALAAHPDDARFRIIASRYYEETGRPADAAACLQDALRVDPKNRGAARQMAIDLASDPSTWARASELIGTWPTADDTAEDRLARAMVTSLDPDRARGRRAIDLYTDLVNDLSANTDIANEARKNLVRLLLDAGRPEEASQVAMIVARTSTDPPTIALYIETLLRSKKFPEAFRQLDRLSAIKPGDAAEAALRVRCLRLSSKAEEVAEALERDATARIDQPGGEPFVCEAFSSLFDLGPPAIDRADRVARAAVRHRPAASWMPALILASRGKAEEALELCRPSAESSASHDLHGAARVAMTVAIGHQSDDATLDKAAGMMDAVHRRDPEDQGLTILAAMMAHLRGRYEDEIGLYRRALKRRPDDPLATNNLAWALSEAMNRPDEALLLIDALIGRIGPRPDILDTRGVILTRAGRFAEAIKNFETSLSATRSAMGYFHLAVALQKAGLVEPYRKARELALKAGLSLDQADLTERDEVASMLRP